MKIEGDYLKFSSGKTLRSLGGYVSIDSDGDLLIEDDIGNADGRYTPELTDQEKWELARFMIDRWMSVRDKLWEGHEEEMRKEPVETKKEEAPYITKEHTTDLVWLSKDKVEPKTFSARCTATSCGCYEERQEEGCALIEAARHCDIWPALKAERDKCLDAYNKQVAGQGIEKGKEER